MGAHVGHNSGNNEWYTPDAYVEAARLVMGAVDLDPASSELANTVIRAARFFTEETDGLSQEWAGRVWMNPPYAAKLIGRFTDKLAASVRCGSVTEAVVLVNNATETRWFQSLSGVVSAACFPSYRIRFWSPTGVKAAPLQGQAILYCGPQAERFIDEFRAFGLVAEVVGGLGSGRVART